MSSETRPPEYEPFGSRSSADETRQAQHVQGNDVPTDVNMNAVVAREQAGTFTIMGKNFEASARAAIRCLITWRRSWPKSRKDDSDAR